jgi:hypothetical protein
MTNLTRMEKLVLTAIDNSDFGYSLQDAVWTFSLEGCVPKASLGGVVSSLSKKGLILSLDIYGEDEATVEMTKTGVDIYISEVNATPEKPM